MAKFQATFERKGRKVTMTVEAPHAQNAREVASCFQMSRGRLVDVKAVKA